jgi:hypothetical protein
VMNSGSHYSTELKPDEQDKQYLHFKRAQWQNAV